MAKKEKTEEQVDLKPRAEKVSKEHLEQMQRLVNAINTIQFNIGKIESQKHSMLHNLSITQDRIAVMQDTLTKEYGSYDVSLEDGTINWPKEEEGGDEK